MITGISIDARTALAIAFRDALINTPDGSNVHLYQNDFTPNPQSVLTDFTECDFVGYAEVAVGATWTDTLVPQTGEVRVYTTVSADFTAGVILAPQTAYGFYVTDDADAVLQGFGRFDEPVLFSASGESLPLVPEWLVTLQTLVAEVGVLT